uniref:NADH-ubiquinone oxidoreductase chain 4 n=1 Tax=Triaenodes qinglingensis TaxID=2904906 RepID=A0A9E8RT78_9NEOP|nr:NADH dehydrogenase subunit 4 [Triaenodes qinglingensis]UZZ44437.1 NADH dehydrogenase subunit 4 [Triaenodes qinglingensis]
MMSYLLFMISLLILMNFYWLVQMSLILLMVVMVFNSLDFFCFMKLYGNMGFDLMSFCLILLSIWIIMLMYMASFMFYINNYNLIMLNLMFLLLLIFLYLTFSVLDMFMFYLFFESSLIPMVLLIFGWGFQLERVNAVIYLLFYTLFVSLPLMVSIFYIYTKEKSVVFNILLKCDFNSVLLYFMMMMAFLVKLPMVFVHLWLPKAHVEAPVSGSMILAGVMLKLGCYGMIRVVGLFSKINLKIGGFLVSLSLVGSAYICLLCLYQVDFKKLIAYSSVVHMGIFLAGLMTMSNWGIMGGIYMMIGHGLCSSGLFSLINLNYERLHTRSLVMNKGMLNILPSFSLWWFLLLSSNMAAPFSLNLISEISIINSLVGYSFMCAFFILVIFFGGGVYNLYLFMVSQHGKVIYLKNNFFNLSIREYLLMFLHWVPLNLLFLKLEFFLY